MIPRRLTLALLAAGPAAWLAACSQESSTGTSTSSPADPPIDTAQAYEASAQGAKGFTAGALMSAHTVYVFFDPQCPHCGHLWQAAMPLLPRLKFVWAPVSLLGAKSLPQGAALLQATNPVEAMTAHEASLLAGQGGTTASANVPADVEAAIQGNTRLLNRLGAEAVPFIVARHAVSGQVLTHAGSMDTNALAAFLGVSPT